MASFYTNEGDHHMLPPNEYLLHQNQKLSSYHFEQFNNPQFNHHGLSLSLGSQEPVHFNPYDNSRLFSLLNSGGPHLSQSSGFSLCNSKYLEAARDLLDELVSVHRVSTGVVRDSDSLSRVDAGPSEAQEPSRNELSLHELQDKLTKLVSMLDEVERRYQQYRHQMRQLASSFDASAGPGASPPYTSLALRTISCQFRGLKDSIKKQIFSVQKRIGGDSNVGKGVIARLRYVDQQLRQQQKSVHQFGVMRQAWRPQRGLPENAVSVLRAWLFEHFLHPYPKDSEKVVLARETGLTRNQVANWFINARVRLWKPMIEEMYKEEFGFAETKLESSPEHTTNQTEFQETLVSSSRGMNDSFQSDFRLDHMQTNHNFVQEKSDEGAMKTQVTLALGLQRSENCPDGIQPTRNEYFYADNNSNLLPADFVV